MENFSDVKFCIGPMSKNIVDSIIKYVNDKDIKMILIPSRRQIEYDGGYVNNWTTEELCSYVRSRTKYIYIQRDHGGPGQGTNMDDGLESFKEDAKLLDIIHIDPWKKYQDYDEGLKYTIDLINYCYKLNNNLYFEVATEEAIRPFSVDDLRKLLIDLKKLLNIDVYNRIVYFVVQSGTSLKEGINTGIYSNEKLKDMMKLSKEFNILTKEHNGDWITDNEITDKFSNELSALNIAPEFGMIETKVILDEIGKLDDKKSNDFFEKFFMICYESKKWVKWVNEDFVPFDNKRKLIEICGHYVFTDDNLITIKTMLPNIDEKINQSIYNRLEHLYSLLPSKNVLTNEYTMETLFVLKDFPVSMSCVPIDYTNYKYMDMTFQICKKTGILQIKDIPSFDDIYITPHNSTSYGHVWDNLFKIVEKKVNNIFNENNFKNVLEIGSGSLLLASKILENNLIKKYIVYENNLTKMYTNDERLELNKCYFTKETIIKEEIDIAIHSHVLEHTINPVEFIKSIKKLHPKYHIIIVPNLNLQFKNKFTNSFNFEHNMLITEKHIDILLNNNNFEILEKEYYLDHSIIYITKYCDSNTILDYPNLYIDSKKNAIDFKEYHIEIINKINRELVDFNGSIYLFGAHIFSQYLIKFGLNTDKILNILDNSIEKENYKLYGTELVIKNPSIISGKTNIVVIVKAASYQQEIEEQLLELNENIKIIR